MRKAILCLSAIPLALAALSGCGGGNKTTTSNEVPVVMTVHDAPATGVTMLSFSAVISGVTITNSSGTAVSLLSSPVTVNLQNLATQSDILADTSAPAGTYSSMMVTLSSVNMTIQNNSGSTVSIGATSCTNTSVCTGTATLAQVSDTISSSPFPLTLIAGVPVNLALDFNLNSSVATNLSVTPTITVTASTTTQSNGELANVSGITGEITSVGSNQFTVTDMNTGASYTLNTSTSGTNATAYSGYSSTCSANNFSCLATGQIASVNFGVGDSNPTTLSATSVGLNSGFTNTVEGTVVGVNPGTGTLTVVANGTSGTGASAITAGKEYTVNATGATYSAYNTGLTTPSGLTFSGISNVGVGQTVLLNPSSISGSTFTSNEVELYPGSVSGNLNLVSGNNLTLNGLNGLYSTAGYTTLQIDTQTGTTYECVTNLGGLATGTSVTAGGELYETTNGPVLVGGQVGQATSAGVGCTP